MSKQIEINNQTTDVPEGAVAWKYTDPMEEARWIYDEAEAEQIASEDPSLIVWVEALGGGVAIRRLIMSACEYLDPNRQGDCWPDPIEWDGRPLDEQARDLCAMLDAREDDEKAVDLSQRLWDAVERAE